MNARNLPIVVALLILCGCDGGKQTSFTPQPESFIPVPGKYKVTIANSPSAPSGWTFVAQSMNLGAIAINPCTTNFNTLMAPATLQTSLNGCAQETDIPRPAGQANWIQTLIIGTPTTQLFSGETVYYALRASSADGSSGGTFSGTGTFTSTTTASGTTTSFSYQINGPLNCVSFNGGSCSGWNTTFNATVQ
jgi:hypothetical protein